MEANFKQLTFEERTTIQLSFEQRCTLRVTRRSL